MLINCQRERSEIVAFSTDIEEYRMDLPKDMHITNPNGIHTNSGGNWNAVWQDFFNSYGNGTPSSNEILDNMNSMINDFGLQDYEWGGK